MSNKAQSKKQIKKKEDVDLRDRAVRAYAMYAQPVGINRKSKCSTELPTELIHR